MEYLSLEVLIIFQWDYAGSLALKADIQDSELVQTKGSDQEVNMLDETEEGREPDKAKTHRQ